MKAATATIIIQTTEARTAEEVEKQVLNYFKDHHGIVKSVQKIRNGVNIACESAKDAQELKKIITEDLEAREALEDKNASLRKKEISFSTSRIGSLKTGYQQNSRRS